jgi:hypothetical protein
MCNVPSFSRPVKTCTGTFFTTDCGRDRLCIDSGKKNKWYVVDRLASDFGDAYRLSPCCGHRLATGEASYEVLIAGRDTSCTCPGHAYTGGCKHVSALLQLRAEGRLS